MRRASGLDRHWRRCRCSAEPCNRPHQLARHRRTASALGRSHFQPPARLRCGQASIAGRAAARLLVRGGQAPIPAHRHGRPLLRNGSLGHRNERLPSDLGSPRCNDHGHGLAGATGCPGASGCNRARAVLYCSARGFLSPGRSRFSAAHRCLRAGDGATVCSLSARCGCGSLLCTRAARAGAA